MLSTIEVRLDPDAETVLVFAGVEWVVKVISLEDIDWHESANNCARLWNPLNSSKIEDYKIAMESGDVFPMPVVEAAKSGMIILGGNQRMNAAKAINADMRLQAYVVRPLLTSQREIVIRSLNARHGWGSEKEERLAHAVFLVRKHGVTTSDAAKLLMVSTSSITMRIRADEAKASLARKGVDASRMSMGGLSAIGSIQDEKHAVTVARIAIEHNATADTIIAAVNRLNSAKSTAEKSAITKEFQKHLVADNSGKNKPGVVKRPRREKVNRLMDSLASFLDRGNDNGGFTSLDELQCVPDEDSDKLKVLANKIIVRLNMILELR